MKHYNSWDEIDQDTGGLVTSLTYIVLFLNDQVYNSTIELRDNIKNTSFYKHEVKKHVNDLYKFMRSYNTNIGITANVNQDALAIITQSMEDDIKPHIDRYGFAISQSLHNAGIHRELNNLISISSTIDMLCQASKITIRDFYTAICKYAPLACNPLLYLSMDKAMFLTRRITDCLTPKDVHIDLNEIPTISTAFQAIANKLLSPEVFEKAFSECEIQ